jgi:hypothetical protein
VRSETVGVLRHRAQTSFSQQRFVFRFRPHELNQPELARELSLQARELGGVETLNERRVAGA